MVLVSIFCILFILLIVDEYMFDKAKKIAAENGVKTNLRMMLSGIYFYIKVRNK